MFLRVFPISLPFSRKFFMRSALLFPIRFLSPAMVLGYVVAMLASSCMPLADALGAAQAVPRWEFWFLHASVPSAIWWQWTGGLQPITVFDRLPILAAATVWLLSCWWIGKWVLRFDPVETRLSKYERIGVSILVGQSALSSIVFLHCWLFGTSSFGWLLAILFFISIALWRFRINKASGRPETTIALEEDLERDVSFDSSISRRMVGLLFLATAFLACIQAYGATIPTHDMQVREVDWWIAKHAAQDGRLLWSAENALANAPAGFAMPSVAFVSLLTMDLPSNSSHGLGSIEQRERWNGRLLTGVLAGKTVNALLCLVGVFLASVHIGRRRGYLPGLFVGFLLVATPGIAELTRLGRTEVLLGIWSVALLVVWHAAQESKPSKLPLGLVWGVLLAGAFSSGYGSGVVIGLPAVVLWICSFRRRMAIRDVEAPAVPLRQQLGRSLALPLISLPLISNDSNRAVATKGKIMVATLFAVVLLATSVFYLRNLIASGDPFYPWGGVVAQQLGMVKRSENRDSLLYAYRVPSETTSDFIAATSEENTVLHTSENKSPYRLENWQDGIFRLLGNSNAHGLILVPFAIVGIMFGRSALSRVAIFWFVYWVSIWWCCSTRQDRDWVGALILLCWPAASGAHWMARQVYGMWMMFFVSIAILWSVVVIPIWPTSDNRLFVGLDSFNNTSASQSGSKTADSEVAMLPTFSREFNTKVHQGDGFTANSKLLLIGENDDFELLVDCLSNGPFDQGLLDKWLGLPAKEVGSLLRSHGISHVLVVWSGVQYREGLTGRQTESKYRIVINELLGDSQLVPIRWEINSSKGELFQVIE